MGSRLDKEGNESKTRTDQYWMGCVWGGEISELAVNEQARDPEA